MRKYLLIICIVSLGLSDAQAAPELGERPSEPDERPKVGLVLSGGGARGFAHVGALRVIEEAGIPVDVITGSSMGSIIGALYALGYTPDQMEDIIRGIDWDNSLSDNGPREFRPVEEKRWDGMHFLSLPIRGLSVRLPSGLIAGQQISKTLSRLTWPANGMTDFSQFPIPFACVATDLETGQAYVLSEGSLPDALRASIAIPTLFTPKYINGRKLIDGGLVMNVPASVAKKMGADIIIVVDVTSPLATSDSLEDLIDILNQMVRFQMFKSNVEQLMFSNLVIEPEVQAYSILDFDRADQLIESGRKAAMTQWDQLVMIRDSLLSYGVPLNTPVWKTVPDTVFIDEVEFHGLSNVSERLARDQMGIEPGNWTTRYDLEYGISKLYGLNFFETASYNLHYRNDSTPAARLVVTVRERETDTFRFGFSYKNRTGAALYFNTIYRNLITPSSTLRIGLRLGQQPYIDSQYFNYLGGKSKFGLRSRLLFKQHNIDLFDQERRIFNVNANSFSADLFLYPVLSPDFIAGAGYRKEAFNYSGSIGIGQFPYDWSNLHIPYLKFEYDTLDDILFPRKGHRIDAGADLAAIPAGSVNYRRYSLSWNGYIPVDQRGSLVSFLRLGYTGGDNLPLHQRFFLGGYPDFLGFYPQEFSGNRISTLQLGYQRFFNPGFYARLSGNIGSTDFGKETDHVKWHTGFGLSLKTSSRLGPLGITFSSGSRHTLLIEINAGFNF